MILELAVQSIQNKLRLGSSTMLGNYEFYYAAGVICGKLQLTPGENISSTELHEFISNKISGKEFADPVVAHLARMIRYYKVEENYDEQMGQLFQMGQNDAEHLVKK